MKTNPIKRRRKPGFASYLLVLTTGAILTALTVSAYRRASSAHKTQSSVQMQTDYAEKEDAVLRSIVAITPNRAMRAMMNNSNSNDATRAPLSWQTIFTESLDMANARTSISNGLQATLNIANLKISNAGDSTLANPNLIFRAAKISSTANPGPGYVSSGTISDAANFTPEVGYPLVLRTGNGDIPARDSTYPIISNEKRGVGLAVGDSPNFNVLTYPNINFGYATPGANFVAKRNWWAFSLNMSANDVGQTQLTRPSRDMVLSIYEIPSQLAISASSFMSLGRLESGENWGDVTIDGNVFAGRAAVDGDRALAGLSSRRSMTLAAGTRIGGMNLGASPFTPGERENHQMMNLDPSDAFPVSLSSESGRVAFIPINRGRDFFDRFVHNAENNTLSPTTWNNYSIGALQCAMRLDIIQCESALNKRPTDLRFSYFRNGVREEIIIPPEPSSATSLPAGYIYACQENMAYDFGSDVVDLAYGHNGQFYFQRAKTGSITFNNARFGISNNGASNSGYYKPSYPFERRTISGTPDKHCIAIYPKRFGNFLASIGADGPVVNHSLVVNVDYTTATGSVWLNEPAVPCTDLDYGLILEECSNMTDFPRGFSLVSNLRTYIGDDFNIVPYTTPPPPGYTPPPSGYYPPCSLFYPDKRYGVKDDPINVDLQGQIGSLASDTIANPVRPLDSRKKSGVNMTADNIRVNLLPITHPHALPPITMMNWLVVLEERRREFIGN